jgi:hypothetical protein
VIVIDPELPRGLVANTAAILDIALARRHSELVGSWDCCAEVTRLRAAPVSDR